MKDNILHIRQAANNIKEKLRSVFTLNIHHRIPPFQTVVNSHKRLGVVVVVERKEVPCLQFHPVSHSHGQQTSIDAAAFLCE
jgi:hypothetical protein